MIKIGAKITLLLLFNCLTTTTIFNSTPNYILQYKPLADSLSVQYKIPSKVILAIAILESDYGRSKVALRLNNHFGITAKKNSKHKSKFEYYASVKESYIAFCKRTVRCQFYAKCALQSNYKVWINHISKTGYSTQPKKWRAMVLKTILINHLE